MAEPVNWPREIKIGGGWFDDRPDEFEIYVPKSRLEAAEAQLKAFGSYEALKAATQAVWKLPDEKRISANSSARAAIAAAREVAQKGASDE